MRSPKFVYLIILILYFCFACQDAKTQSSEVVFQSNEVTSTEEFFDETKALKSRGHVSFVLEEGDTNIVSMRSLQQPGALVKKVSKTEFVLSDLLPQRHTLIAEKNSDGEKHFVVFEEVEVLPNKSTKVGLLAFQKSGTIVGRLLATETSSPLSQLKVNVTELSRTAVTADTGEFVLKDLPSGKWRLQAVVPTTGHQVNTIIHVKSGEAVSVGDLWLGDPRFMSVSAELTNGFNNITSEPKAKFRFAFPPGIRFVTLKSKEGTVYIDKGIAKQNIEFELTEAVKTTLDIFLYDDLKRLMGVTNVPFQYDPFSNSGKEFIPHIKVLHRVLKSPARKIAIDLSERPNRVHRVRFGIDGVFDEWRPVEDSMQFEIPKSNLSCGERKLMGQFQNEIGHSSGITSIPLTLSCWERIPNRAALDQLVGIDNAAVWTGTHVFVWSGRQFPSSRAGPWGGSNAYHTVKHLESLQTYEYKEGGYVYRPAHNADKSSIISDLEFIVTDNAPSPRALAGIGGRDNFVAVYGGENADGPLADGAIFDISNNGWISMMEKGAPSARVKPFVFFLDENRVLVWGGKDRTNSGYERPLNDGAIYNLQTHQWSPITMSNAPTARFSPLGLLIESKLYIFGGTLAGGVDVLSGGIYDPATNSWKENNLDFPTTGMSATSVNDEVIFFGRDKQIKILNLRDGLLNSYTTIGNNLMTFEPQMVLDGDGKGPNGSLLYIFGGRTSALKTDANEEVVRLVYKYNNELGRGTIVSTDPRQASFNANAAFGMRTVNGRYNEKCCLNALAFSFENFIFVINASIVSMTNVFQSSTFLPLSDGGGKNYTAIQNVTLAPESRRIGISGNNNVTLSWIDTVFSTDFPNRSPYMLWISDPPVWNEQNRTLMFYGGIYVYYTSYGPQQGGYLYNIDSKTWSKLPAATFEQYAYSSWHSANRYFSRNNSLRLLIDGVYYLLGGYLQNQIVYPSEYSGIKFTFTEGTPNAPSRLDFQSTPLDFSLNSTSHYYNSHQFRTNPACLVGKQILLTGGVREHVRSVENLEQSSALFRDKVIFDASTESLRKASDGPLGVRAGLTAVAAGNVCFLWGGYTAENAFHTTDQMSELNANAVFQGSGATYSFETDEWTSVPMEGAPSARALMQGVWTGKDILLWGGTRNTVPSVSQNNFEEKGVWRYHPEKMKWTILRSAPGEPRFTGLEVPVWLGTHLFIWQPPSSEFSYFFNPEANTWSQLPRPFGFGKEKFYTSRVVWTGEKVFIMPLGYLGPALMAFFIPPDP